jgi:DNA-binding CsgD family transcriptional regulator
VLKKINQTLLDLYDHAHQGGVQALSEQVFKRLQEVLPGESGALYEARMSPDQPTRVQSCLAFGNAREKINYRVSHVDSDRLRGAGGVRSRDRLIERATRQPGQTFSQDIHSIGDKQIYAYAQKFESQQALLHVRQQGQQYQLFSLWRASLNKPFSSDELKIGNLVIPHVFKALDIAQTLACLKNGQDNQLICNWQGDIVMQVGRSAELLEQEWPGWTQPRLPDALLDTFRASWGRQAMDFVGRRIRAHAQLSESLLLIELKTRNKNTDLTAAERLVAEWAAHGLSYKEIGQKLGTSPATVRNQLHRVYQKLGVAGKAALRAS